jgi:hypothetical protein
MRQTALSSDDNPPNPRRIFLGGAGLAAVIFSAIGATAAVRPPSGNFEAAQDVQIMQGALALEHEGIAAYELAGASGLLTPGALKVALIFQGHHKAHRDSLAALIRRAGGDPAGPKSDAEYAHELDLGSLKSESDVVALATRLEMGATNAYVGQVAALKDPRLAHLFTQLATDETVHWTTLNNAQGKPIPENAYLFG